MLSRFIIPYDKIGLFFERKNLLWTINLPILEEISTTRVTTQHSGTLTFNYSNTTYS